MPFLRAELNLNYTISALHLSAFALGIIIAGMTGDVASARIGRKRLFWGGAFGMLIGLGVLLTGQTPFVTIFAALLMGIIGSYLLVVIQATLVDHHGVLRAIALTEANVMASLFATFAPLLIGGSDRIGLGWRFGLVVAALFIIGLFFFGKRAVFPNDHTQPIAAQATEQKSKQSPLPRTFWFYWVLLFFVTSVEWLLIFWGADFLEISVGLERATASTLMTVFFFAMVIGRVVGSRLTRTVDPRRLIFVALLIVAVGFPIFWLAQLPILNIFGLFLAGLGVANLFPLILSVATSISPQQANQASARVTFGAGLAILIMPQVAGAIADQVGIMNALSITGILIVLSLVIAIIATRQPTTES